VPRAEVTHGMDNRPGRRGGLCVMTQAHPNWINRPGRGRSLPRQLPPKNGGVM
jgi:hypothetical protein